jgi:hypothetical protein
MTKMPRNAMRKRQRIGATMASREVTMDPTRSKIENKGFPIPAVAADDAARIATVVPWTKPAIPPPVISASVHWRNGDRSVIMAAVVTVPAIIAAGVVIISRT